MNYQTFCQMFKYQMHFQDIEKQLNLILNILVPNPNQKYVKFYMIVVFEIVCGIILVSYIRILTLFASNQDATARGSTFYHFNQRINIH